MIKIKTIIRKEWAQVFKNKMVLFTILFMPIFFTALPLIILYFTSGLSGSSDLSGGLPAEFSRMCSADLSAMECIQVSMTSQFLFLFMLLPLVIPVSIGAYSIVGEKTTRTLEPLLATPITTYELLSGKNLAGVIPAVLATWGGFLVYAVGAMIITGSPRVVRALLDPAWILAVAFVGPLMAILSVNFAIMISSRVNDPRVAEQLSTLVMVPVLALFFAQLSGVFMISREFVLIAAVVMILVDSVVLYLAVRLFQREVILTRWK